MKTGKVTLEYCHVGYCYTCNEMKNNISGSTGSCWECDNGKDDENKGNPLIEVAPC
jgi:hypothetical protein